MDFSSSSSSSTPPSDSRYKAAIRRRIQAQIETDKACRDTLTEEFLKTSNNLDARDLITKVLTRMPASCIRDLAVLFMIDVGKRELDELKLLGKAILELNCSMELKLNFLMSLRD